MENKDIKDDLNQVSSGKYSNEQKQIAERWLFQLNTKNKAGLSEANLTSAEAEVWERLEERGRIETRRIKLWPRIAVAASIALAIGVGSLLYVNKQDNGNKQQMVQMNDVAPGKNGATLTLANGQKILINDALAGNIATQSGVKISKTKDGQIIYEVTDGDNSELTYNTLTTTRGQQSQVRLPDGTLVFLNSESSLRYPTTFSKSDKRMVSLEGEGFFDVSKDRKHPFVVKTGGQEVEVLGTQFNINSYNDERVIKTTLIEGSVKVTNASSVSKILKPNQQSIVSDKGIKVDNVEAQFFVDWKEGFFMFDNETLESIMNRVSRWYDVKVIYEDAALKIEKASGTVSKFDNISSVLQALEQSDLAKFKLSNGVLTISAKK